MINNEHTQSRILAVFASIIALGTGSALPVSAQPRHGIAMVGDPALPPDFAHLPHANPDAPHGGRIVLAEVGGFDSVNPFILRGSAPWGVQLLTTQSLLGRNYSEAFGLYGVLAETVETDDSRAWVEFTLRPEARFSDGSPVTVADVMWSFETLGTLGHPRYHGVWGRIAAMEQTGPASVRFTFTEADQELPLIIGLRPILSRAQFEGGTRVFDASGLDAIMGTGPYQIAAVDPGRSITFRAVPDWWGRDLPFFAGQHNADEITYEYFGDTAVAFEAFKAGDISVWREPSAARWADSYDFPAVQRGDVTLSEIPHQRPTGFDGFVFNTRRAQFSDWRVRQALLTLFDFEQINQTLNGGALPRIPSVFGNSALGMPPGAAEPEVVALLARHADSMPPDALDDLTLPSDTGRRALRSAMGLFNEAGWQVDGDGVLRNAVGEAFVFEILLSQGNPQHLTVAQTYAAALEPVGITVTITVIDNAQYVERTNAYDFDMTHMLRFMSLSPGIEQRLYWGSAGVDTPGTRNLAGVDSPVVDAMVDAIVTARTQAEFTTAVRALDRAVMAGRYLIPFWYSPVGRLAHRSDLHFPNILPIYGDWTGFLPEVWWIAE